jgi:hypothetical protein
MTAYDPESNPAQVDQPQPPMVPVASSKPSAPSHGGHRGNRICCCCFEHRRGTLFAFILNFFISLGLSIFGIVKTTDTNSTLKVFAGFLLFFSIISCGISIQLWRLASKTALVRYHRMTYALYISLFAQYLTFTVVQGNMALLGYGAWVITLSLSTNQYLRAMQLDQKAMDSVKLPV